MQMISCIVIEYSETNEVYSNSLRCEVVNSIQRDWMQCILCSVKKWNPIECSGFYAAWLNAVDFCSMIECSGFFEAWSKASWFNAVNFLQHVPIHPDRMHWIPCSMIECRGFYAAWPKASRLNAVDFMQHHWMQWIPCILIECSVIQAAW